MAHSGTVLVLAMKDGDYVATEFAGTTAGLQAAIDYLAGGKGKVFIGPGTISITGVVSVHTGCHIQGSGVGVTVIQRAASTVDASGAAQSGSTFINTAYGANGTLRATTGDADLSFSDMTIDGNEANQAGVNPATPFHMGIELAFVDGVRITNVEVKNFLMTGVYLNESRRAFIDGLYLENNGAYGSGGLSMNGLTLVGGTGTLNYNRNAVVNNLVSDTVTDSHIFCNWSDCSFSNVQFRGAAKIGFELETTTTITSISRVTIENVTSSGLTTQFFTADQFSGTGATFSDILVRNVACAFDASAHASFAVRVGSGNAIIKRFQMNGCTFTNCNSSDSANVSYFFFQTTNTTTQSQDVTLRDCEFVCGVPASTVTTSYGVDVRGHLAGLTIERVTVRDPQGRGIYIATTTSSATQRNVKVKDCAVYNANLDGILIFTSTGGTAKYIDVSGNYIEDSCEQTGDSCGIRVGPVSGSTSMSHVTVKDNRIVKVSSTFMVRGLRIEAGSGSTSDSYIVSGNEIVGLSSGSDLPYQASGTSTNVYFSDPVTRGSDTASSATVTLGLGTLFHVTGTTSITTLNPCVTWDRRPITFIMDSTASFTDGGNMKLAGNGPNTADDTITMAYDGSNWYETARSVN